MADKSTLRGYLVAVKRIEMAAKGEYAAATMHELYVCEDFGQRPKLVKAAPKKNADVAPFEDSSMFGVPVVIEAWVNAKPRRDAKGEMYAVTELSLDSIAKVQLSAAKSA